MNQDDEEFIRRMTSSQRQLRAFIHGLVPHQVDADDVLQEVNMALWRKREKYDLSQDFLRWAFGFASLEVRGLRSRMSRDRLWFNDSVIDSLVEEWPSVGAFLEDSHRSLRNCIQKLGEVERRAVESRYSKRLSVDQIAELTERPASTVYKILNRARESLRGCIERSRLQSDGR
ncbi:MAG: sigma-70 family RNA polymerase sigma factor [Planctomycetales bacterium]|nr:sigma-70 family RNA polymerase sigma factor [Planctomycetales bacterium]